MSFSSHFQLNVKLNPQREIPYLLVPGQLHYSLYNYVNGKNDSNIDQIILSSCLLKPTLMMIINFYQSL